MFIQGPTSIPDSRVYEIKYDLINYLNPLHRIERDDYDYVVINDNIDKCYSKISNLIDAEINNGSKDYDKDYIRRHVEVLTS